MSTSPLQTRRKRYYTLAEARRALPLVRSIVRDITEAVAQYKAIKLGLLGRASGARDAERRAAAEHDLADCEDRLRTLRLELASLGVEIKDLASGLVDFRARHEGRDVWICWRHGEADIGFWHEKNAGFAGRKPVSELAPAGHPPAGPG